MNPLRDKCSLIIYCRYSVSADISKKSRIGASLLFMCINCIYSVIYLFSLNCTSMRMFLYCVTLTCIGILSKGSGINTI